MLALVMFLNGMAVMVLEMVGARLLAPWLGTSVVVWTSLIGVILASLSIGYWLGGRLADSSLRVEQASGGKKRMSADKNAMVEDAERQTARAQGILALILLTASIFVVMTALLQSIVLERLSLLTSSLHLTAVGAALVLFAVPSLLCGMVSPYAMRLAITKSETSGAVIGRLNAISTIGSIVGTFLGGFVLISWFGSTEITLGVAGCLLVAAALAQKRPVLPKAALAACIVLAVIGSKSYSAYMADSGSIAVETPYSSMRVANGTLKNRPMRLLLTDPGSCQSGVYMDDPVELAFAYTTYYALGTYMNPDAKKILMLGGGGYSVPKWLLSGRSELTSKDFRLDVVELDPGVTKVAQKYFWAPKNDPRMTIFHEDARSFINRMSMQNRQDAQQGHAPYDIIFADIFNSYYTVPFHVGTVEAAQKIHSLLAEDGIFIMNIITAVEGDNGRLLRSIHNAFAQVFDTVYLFPVQSRYDGTLVQNVMLMAFRTPRPLPDPLKEQVPDNIFQILQSQWTTPLPAPEKDVPALCDNFAPVERYTLGFLP